MMELFQQNPLFHWTVVVVAMVLLVFVLMTATAYTVWFERVALGHMQARPGPNRVGPWGLMQLAADGIKLAFKESFIPSSVDKLPYLLAPAIAMAAALLAWAVIPVGLWYGIYYSVIDVNIGILLVLAVGAMNVYALMLGGWSSNNKYSLLGGLRAAAQLISYEMGLGLSLVPIFMIVGSLRLLDIVNYQVHWGIYNGPLPLIILAPISFMIYLFSSVAETNRAPFDLPEAEQEIIGFHTEYSGFKFVLFYVAEYMNVITASTLASLIFLAGWQGPLLPPILWLLIKVIFFIFVFIWLRGTFPRLRYDMLMRMGWKLLLPLAMANVIITAVILVIVQG